MSSASRGLAPREGLERLLMKMGRTRPLMEPRHGPQAGKSGYPGSQNADSIHCLFFMKAIFSTVTTEECETRQPSELGMGTTPSFLMYHSVAYKVGYKVTTFSHFLSIYFLSDFFTFFF